MHRNPDLRCQRTCNKCNGRGIVVEMRQLGGGFIFQQVQTACSQCEGRGKNFRSVCPFCRGKRIVQGNNELTIAVPEGSPEGYRLVMEEESDQSPDFVPGDLELILRTSLHPVYRRDGDNLYANVVLTLQEAMLGFTKEMLHLDGTKFVLCGGNCETSATEANSWTPETWRVVQPGQVEVLRGKGMPKYQQSNAHGDLFIEYQVVLPSTLTYLCSTVGPDGSLSAAAGSNARKSEQSEL